MQIDEFLKRLLAHMGIEEAEVTMSEEDNLLILQVNVNENDSGLLIGYHGDVLASLQRILQLVYREKLVDKKIILNINDYKQRREAQLKEMATKIAYRVIEFKQPYLFSYLPANERLVIHQTIVENPDFIEIESISTGEGSGRRLQIRLKAA